MPDLIDYSGESTEDTPSSWTYTAFKKYFMDTYWKVRHAGGAIPWTMKEQVLLSTMLKEFSPEDLADMILWWHINTPKSAVACQLTNFYSNRVQVYHKMKEATSDYKWE